MTDEERIRADERERIATWLEKRGITRTEDERDDGWWDTSMGANYGRLILSLLRTGKYIQDDAALEKQP
jgi:hypothetical protein